MMRRVRLQAGIVPALFLIALCLAGPPAGAADCSKPGQPPDRTAQEALFKAQEKNDKGDTAGAREILKKYEAENPKSFAQVAMMRGCLAYQVKDGKEALRHFVRAVDLDPCWGEPRRNLAVVLNEEGRKSQAAFQMLEAHRLITPEDPDLLYNAGVLYLLDGKPAQALPPLTGLAGRPNPKSEWLTALVRAHVELKQFREAEAVLDRLLAREPGRQDLWRLLAGVRGQRKDYSGAAAALLVAVRLGPADAANWRELGDLYLAAGVPREAAEAYARAYGADPGAREWERLARLHMAGGEREEALEAANKAARLEPSARNLSLAGQILLDMGRIKEAHKVFLEAAAAPGGGAGEMVLAGYAAWRADLPAEAEAAFGKAVKLAGAKGKRSQEARSALEAVRSYRNLLKETGERPEG